MKKRISKITSILLVILLAFTAVSLVACGSDSEKPSDDGAVKVITDSDGNVLTVEDGSDDAAEDDIVDTAEDGIVDTAEGDGENMIFTATAH